MNRGETRDTCSSPCGLTDYLGANSKNLKCTPRIWRKPKKAPQRMILANLKLSRFARDLKGD